jgi:hypothetical protein
MFRGNYDTTRHRKCDYANLMARIRLDFFFSFSGKIIS